MAKKELTRKLIKFRTSSQLTHQPNNEPLNDQEPTTALSNTQVKQLKNTLGGGETTTLTPAVLQQLQNTHGNQFVQRLVQRAKTEVVTQTDNASVSSQSSDDSDVFYTPPQSRRGPVSSQSSDDSDVFLTPPQSRRGSVSSQSSDGSDVFYTPPQSRRNSVDQANTDTRQLEAALMKPEKNRLKYLTYTFGTENQIKKVKPLEVPPEQLKAAYAKVEQGVASGKLEDIPEAFRPLRADEYGRQAQQNTEAFNQEDLEKAHKTEKEAEEQNADPLVVLKKRMTAIKLQMGRASAGRKAELTTRYAELEREYMVLKHNKKPAQSGETQLENGTTTGASTKIGIPSLGLADKGKKVVSKPEMIPLQDLVPNHKPKKGTKTQQFVANLSSYKFPQSGTGPSSGTDAQADMDDQLVDAYRQEITQNAWGGEGEIRVIGEYFGVSYMIHHFNDEGGYSYSYMVGDGNNVRHLLHGNNHYQALVNERVQDVPGDGSCAFQAAYLAANSRIGTARQLAMLRQHVSANLSRDQIITIIQALQFDIQDGTPPPGLSMQFRNLLATSNVDHSSSQTASIKSASDSESVSSNSTKATTPDKAKLGEVDDDKMAKLGNAGLSLGVLGNLPGKVSGGIGAAGLGVTDTTFKGKTDPVTKEVTQIGTSSQASDIIGSAQTLLGLGQLITDITTAQELKKGDEAQKLQAKHMNWSIYYNAGNSVVSVARVVLNYLHDFRNLEMANKLPKVLPGYVPGIGLAANILSLINNAKNVLDQLTLSVAFKGHAAAAHAAKENVLEGSLAHVNHRAVQLSSHYVMSIITDIIKIGSNIETLTGVAAVAGLPTNISATILGLGNGLAKEFITSYQSGRAQKTMSDYRQAKPGSAKEVLKYHPKHVAQTMVTFGRNDHQLALAALAEFGITQEVLTNSTDENLRGLILMKIEEEGDPANITQQFMQFGKLVKEMTPETITRAKKLRAIKDAKNALNYGGKNSRGSGWVAKQYFGGNVPNQLETMKEAIENDNSLSKDRREDLLDKLNLEKTRAELDNNPPSNPTPEEKSRMNRDVQIGQPSLNAMPNELLQKLLATMTIQQIENMYNNTTLSQDKRLFFQMYLARRRSQLPQP